MSHYGLSNNAYQNGSHQQQPALASISDLIPQNYSQGPQHPPILPPLQSPAQSQYRHGIDHSLPLRAPAAPHEHAAAAHPSHYPQHPHVEGPQPAFPSSLAAPSHEFQSTSALQHHHGYPLQPASSSYAPSSLPHLAPSVFPQYEHGQPPPYGQPQVPSQVAQPRRPEDNRVLAVVGSQGRRGILPVDKGKEQPPPALGNSRSAGMTPAKNSAGKYPCYYCNKTYLHLKHLKRHHLRHTGERPYQCSLCHETFCRSDILKRHFNKCSIRRGNPDGLTHLQHAQAHLQPAATPTSGAGHSTGAPNGQSAAPIAYRTSWPSGPTENGYSHFSNASAQLPSNGHANATANEMHSSRSSSVVRTPSSGEEDRKRYSEPNLSTHTSLAPMQANLALTPPPTDRSAGSSVVDGRDGVGSDRTIKQERYATYQQQPPHHQEYYAPLHTQAPPPQHAMAYSQPDAQQSQGPYYRNGGNHHVSYPSHMASSHGAINHDQWAVNCFNPGARDHMMFTGQ